MNDPQKTPTNTLVVGISRERLYEWIRAQVATDLGQLGLAVTDVGVEFKCVLFVEASDWPGSLTLPVQLIDEEETDENPGSSGCASCDESS